MVRKLVTLLLALVGNPGLASESLLAPPFADHGVLQRDRPIALWGEAIAHSKITVALAGHSTKVTADGQGHWRATLPAMPAGGPYRLEASSSDGRSQAIEDLLIGEVWLCSGQSNMELQVKRSLDSRSEILAANHPNIRLMTIGQGGAAVPQTRFATAPQWQAVTPATIAEFSAACYFFARELQKSLEVPFGLISAAAGGANIRTYLSPTALHSLGSYERGLDLLQLYSRDPDQAMRQWGLSWQDWWNQSVADAERSPWSRDQGSAGWRPAPLEKGPWEDWGEADLAHYTGVVFFQARLALTSEQAAKPASLDLGLLNEEDIAWVNGQAVGAQFGFAGRRLYHLPQGALHRGENTVTLAVYCSYRGCGMLPGEFRRGLLFEDHSRAEIAGPWLYHRPVSPAAPMPRVPWGSIPGLGVAYNATIAPLGDYGLAGAIWYQGESNTGDGAGYRPLLQALMADWRRQFRADLPFLIVQLPNYGAPPTRPGASGWAELREAQRQVVAADRHAALAVTIDIGDRYDIHPANKQELGRRLAALARHLLLGDPRPGSGPVADRAVHQDGQIRLSFSGVEGGLQIYSGDQPTALELCDEAGSCRYVGGHLEDESVVIAIPAGMRPARLKHGWADSPIVTLFDGAGRPAAPFSLPIE